MLMKNLFSLLKVYNSASGFNYFTLITLITFSRWKCPTHWNLYLTAIHANVCSTFWLFIVTNIMGSAMHCLALKTWTNINPFKPNIQFLCPLNTLEKLLFSDFFRGYRNGALAQNWFIFYVVTNKMVKLFIKL